MALVSPGVEVTIIDESQYTSAGQNTIPYILLATAENKLTPAGTGIAPGTLASALGDVYLITSQRELVNTFGDPTFYKTSGGSSLHGYELNEYGLMAAYSVLGATNRAYVQRVDVDLAELEASLVRPLGAPDNGSYWFDLAESAYGLFVWNADSNLFVNVEPIVITDLAEVDGGGVPLVSVGVIGDYAVNTTSTSNPIYVKDATNAWVLIGSPDWEAQTATVISTISNPTINVGDNFSINTVDLVATGTTIESLAADINGEPVTDVTAAVVDGKLEIYFADQVDAQLVIGAHSVPVGTLLADVGLTAGSFNMPLLVHDTHINIPRWRDTDTGTTRPSGSIWQKTTSVNTGANIVVKRYDSVTGTFAVQSAPLYENDETANQFLDPATGGLAIAAGDTYVQYDVSEDDTGTFKIFDRTEGATEVTGTATTLTLVGTEDFTIQASLTNNGTLPAATTINLNAGDAASFVADLKAANVTNVDARVEVSGAVTIIHTGGGVIVLSDGTGGPIALLGITDAQANVRLNGASDLVLSNWNTLVYTADTVTPGQDPLNTDRWYYSAFDEIDIMIHEGGEWLGYQNATADTRGHDLSATNPAGPIVAATAPDMQSDGTDIELGDLWIDSSDLENYPVIRRWELDTVTLVPVWTLVDNADQTSSNGVIFEDARWAQNGTTDPVTDDFPLIADLLTEDYVDPDAPNKALYPDGILLWNTRRSGYNVKEFRVNYFNATDFDLTDFGGLTEASTWVTVSGKKDDGSANFGRLAQRALVVQALKAAIDTNPDIREEQREFNLLSCPGYPELIPNMVALNNERFNTGFIVGDSPLRLENTGNAITEWATNNDGLGTPTNDGLASNDEYMGVFYPSGRTNDLTGTTIVVPPSHMILRTIIHSDEQSYPWLAPAGVRRGQVDNADALGYVDDVTGEFVQMSTRQGIRDVLYTNNVNPITFIPGSGIVNYGNKTTKDGSALDRINVSRLVSFIRVQADSLAKPFVFEPNDKQTRDEIKGQMERMLNDLVAKRGIYDYVVVCDRTNNTNVRIDRNELWVDVAIEPVKAAEFIYVPIRIQNTGDISGG